MRVPPGARRDLLSTLLLALLALPSCAPERPVRTIRLAHGLDVGHPVHRAMESMARQVAERSAGALEVEIYPSEQLGSERECVELLQIGSLDMTKVSASVLESFAPSFRVFGLPYLFRDRDHLFSVLEGPIGMDLLRHPERFRIRGLCFYDAGSRSFYTRQRPIRSPADLAGLKIRTQESPGAMRMVRTMGGAATPIAWGELYSALQQGVVDGAENNPPSFHLSRHFEVCDTYSLDEHTSVPDVLLVSTDLWERLTPAQRRIVQEAADASAAYQKRLWQEATTEALEAVAAAGVEILRPPKEPFVRAVEPLLREAAADPLLAPWIERIREAGR
jgi:tripartite ATP-independent transporter DctP family solute receptor